METYSRWYDEAQANVDVVEGDTCVRLMFDEQRGLDERENKVYILRRRVVLLLNLTTVCSHFYFWMR